LQGPGAGADPSSVPKRDEWDPAPRTDPYAQDHAAAARPSLLTLSPCDAPELVGVSASHGFPQMHPMFPSVSCLRPR